MAPLSAYGQSKAAGDLAVGVVPRHYLVRTSWVVGEGANFVRTMQRLAREGARPRVVDDQWGRLTFAGELARVTGHLVSTGAPFGTYHVSGSGPVTTWADLARAIFVHEGRDPADVRAVSTQDYLEGSSSMAAARPARSDLDLSKIRATGFVPADAAEGLQSYLQGDVGQAHHG